MTLHEYCFGIMAEWQENDTKMRLIDGIEKIKADDLAQARSAYEAEHAQFLGLNNDDNLFKLVEIREL